MVRVSVLILRYHPARLVRLVYSCLDHGEGLGLGLLNLTLKYILIRHVGLRWRFSTWTFRRLLPVECLLCAYCHSHSVNLIDINL